MNESNPEHANKHQPRQLEVWRQRSGGGRRTSFGRDRMRLRFTLAAHMDRNALLVDEILAVGDAAFCLKRTRALHEKVDFGTTIIMVSHYVREVMNIWNQASWLRQGRLHDAGPSKAFCYSYYNPRQTCRIAAANSNLLLKSFSACA